MKSIIIPFISLALALACPSCAIEGGMGDRVDDVDYGDYKPQELGLEDVFTNTSITLDILRSSKDCPVEPSLAYIREAFATELEANGARVVKGNDVSDATLKIRLSRYATREFGSGYRTYIDMDFEIVDDIDGKILDSRVNSIAGKGEASRQANGDGLCKLVKKVLDNDRLHRYLSSLARSRGDATTHMLDKLSLSLLKDFEKSGQSGEGIRVAFGGFKDEENSHLNGVFLSSLKRFWRMPKYRFYSRDQLDRILEEQATQLKDVFDHSTIVEIGKLEAVDYLITGKVSPKGKKRFIEAQVIGVEDGEVISSKTTLIDG